MFTGYLSLGGNEIANGDRLSANLLSSDCPAGWFRHRPCGTLQEALGDAPYGVESISSSPWYDQASPELSKRFYGVAALDVAGIHDSSRSMSVTQAITDGGVIGTARNAAKEVRVRAVLAAQGEDALDYGLNWLNAALEPGSCGQHGDACGLSDLSFLTTCPPPMPTYWESTDGEVIARNLFTNPRLKGDGTYAEVARNLFTNPRLVGDGTWAEVRRNRVKNPTPDINTAGSGPYGANMTVSRVTFAGEPWYQVEATAAVTTLGMYVEIGTLFAVGDRAGVSFDIRAAAGGSYPSTTVRTIMGGITAANQVNETKSVTETPLRVSSIVPSVASGGTLPERVYVGIVGSFSAGAKVYFRRILAGDDGNYFDGSKMDATMPQPEDFRVRWLGTPNASESVMEIERVAGLTAVNCVVGVSAQEGKPAARMIPTTSNPDSYARFDIPASARASGTFMATATLRDALTGTLATWGRRIAIQAPAFNHSQFPNTPGTYVQRQTYADLSSLFQARMHSGGALGSGDVWWTDIGLYAGDYKGEYFHGSYSPEDSTLAQPEDFRWRWVGAVDNSESVMEIERVRGLTGSRCIAGVSARSGKPAVRLIATQPDNQASDAWSYAYFIIPAEARASGTAVGTRAQVAAFAGTHGSYKTLRVDAPQQNTGSEPNSAGEKSLRLKYADLTGTYRISLGHGGTAASGSDVWWTDIGLYAGGYDGPNFTGADVGEGEHPQRGFRWVGAPDNSVSEMYELDWTEYPDLAELDRQMRPIERYMHDVAVTSAPTVREYLEISQDPSGPKAAIVEFTITSERGYVYSRAVDVPLLATPDAVEDIERNLFINPTADTSGPSESWRRNLVKNPSLETDATGWTASNATFSRVTGELRAVGSASAKAAVAAASSGPTNVGSIACEGSYVTNGAFVIIGIWGAVSDPSLTVTRLWAEYRIGTQFDSGTWKFLDEAPDVAAARGGRTYRSQSHIELPWGFSAVNVGIRFRAEGVKAFTMYADAAMLIEG